MSKWISEMGMASLSHRRHARLTGITKKDSLFSLMGYTKIVVGFLIGVFVTIAIIKPELIDWGTFSRSFLIGIIMGAR